MVMKKIWICENEENEARKFLHILKTLPEVKGKIRVFCEERHLQTMAFDIRSLPDLVFMDLAFGDHKGIQAAENIHAGGKKELTSWNSTRRSGFGARKCTI